MPENLTIKYHNYVSFWDWLTKLAEDGFFKVEANASKYIYSLKSPLQIEIDQTVVQRIKRRYKADCEIGGILLAEPTLINKDKKLIVRHVRFVENQSKTPDRQYQAKGDRKLHIHKCLCGRKDNARFIPIWFHSHPRQGTVNISELLMTFFQMSTSDADKKSATREISYEVDFHGDKKSEITLKFPSALVIVSVESYMFLGVYGGLIAPNDFREYIQNLLNQTSKEMLDWAGNSDSFWAFLAAAIATVGLGVLSMDSNNAVLRAFSAQTALIIKEEKTDHNYFSLSKGGSELKITIP